MSLHIVLFEPEIPMNTGNIGRLSLASGSKLHLVGPLGFEINDTRLKRAGLDYWQHLNVEFYENQSEFFKIHGDKNIVFLSSHGNRPYWDIPYEDNLYLIFGKESIGLSKDLISKHPRKTFNIPQFSENIRSLNLANAVAITVYEGIKQMYCRG